MCYWSEQLLLSRGCCTQGRSTQGLHRDVKPMYTVDRYEGGRWHPTATNRQDVGNCS
jgi:hypothetical protein